MLNICILELNKTKQNKTSVGSQDLVIRPFSSKVLEAKCFTLITAAIAKSLQSCLTLCDPHPWDSPGKNTGVGCHFLLQHIKVKSESEVTQSCLTLRDPMDCSLPVSSVHGIFQARVLEWGAIAFSDPHYY